MVTRNEIIGALLEEIEGHFAKWPMNELTTE